MFSVHVEGKWEDVRYRAFRHNDFQFVVLAGPHQLGQVFRLGKHNWSALVNNRVHGLRSVAGFGSRRKATEYILFCSGIWEPNEVETRRRIMDTMTNHPIPCSQTFT